MLLGWSKIQQLAVDSGVDLVAIFLPMGAIHGGNGPSKSQVAITRISIDQFDHPHAFFLNCRRSLLRFDPSQ